MADNIDKALNGLGLKTDSLPDDWLVTIVNPKSGEPAENMTVARFVELLSDKIPVVSTANKGVMRKGSVGEISTAIDPSKIIKIYGDQRKFTGIIFITERFGSCAISIVANWGSYKVTNLTGSKNDYVKIKKKDYNLYVYINDTNNDVSITGISAMGQFSMTLEDYDASAGLIDII